VKQSSFEKEQKVNKVFYVTTPIYYVNDKPHIGHAYCTILADVLRRYYDLFGYKTFFLTGVDEHGQKVQEASKKRGMSPQAHCDEMQGYFRALWKKLNISNDDFIRTTEQRHIEVVQNALLALWEKGEIYLGEYEGFYSPRVEKFFSAEELVGGKCPETGGEVFNLSEKNYFFRMGKYRDALVKHIMTHEDFIVPQQRRNEVLGFLQKGLQDLCITRPKSRLEWGIEIPFDKDYVTYVWFDALMNYVSAIGLYKDQARFEELWGGAHHLIGKDILVTHSVYWTTMLMALGLPLPKQIVATGWWLVEQTKMSKSIGNVVDPLSLVDRFGVDSLRYFLMREMVIGMDANFSESAVLRRHNFDLANDLGNLVQRVVRLVEKAFDGKVPEGDAETGEGLRKQAEPLSKQVEKMVSELRLDMAMEQVFSLIRATNRYIAETSPFLVMKKDKRGAGSILRTALEAIRFSLNLLWPVMPEKCDLLLKAIGDDGHVERFSSLQWGGLKAGKHVHLDAPPFQRFEAEPSEVSEKGQEREEPRKPEETKQTYCAFSDFSKLDLRVGTIVDAQKIEGAKKLLRLLVAIGEPTPRQLVAGIALQYEPQSLIGTQVVVVANLEPRKVMGVESKGMILAASDEDGLALITPSRRTKNGAKVS
jgi:methionyl-tRNA synthetase